MKTLLKHTDPAAPARLHPFQNPAGSARPGRRWGDRKCWLLLPAILTLAVLLGSGCQSPESDYPAFESSTGFSSVVSTNDPTYPLQEGDVISVKFEYATNFNTVQKIALDGTVNLQLVGPVPASGVTRQNFESELVTLYEPHVKDKVITVDVISSTSSIYVLGAVLRTGKLPMERPMTIMDAIAEAGGFDPNRANLSSVTVMRKETGKEQYFKVNVKRMLSGKDLRQFYLKPFDIVYVPTKTFSL